MEIRKSVVSALVGGAVLAMATSANAANISGSQGPFGIDGAGGSQGYGVNLPGGAVGDTFDANFIFNVLNVAAVSFGASAIESINSASLSFSKIELFDSGNNLLATGVVQVNGGVDSALIAFGPLPVAGGYTVKVSGSFLSAGNGSIGGTVSLQPVPVPAALPLMISAIAAVGLVGARRKS